MRPIKRHYKTSHSAPKTDKRRPTKTAAGAPEPVQPRGPPRRVSAYEISKSTGFQVDFGFQNGFLDFKVDFWISKWISGFQSGFLDFKVDFSRDFWILSEFLDFKADFWISFEPLLF